MIVIKHQLTCYIFCCPTGCRRYGTAGHHQFCHTQRAVAAPCAEGGCVQFDECRVHRRSYYQADCRRPLHITWLVLSVDGGPARSKHLVHTSASGDSNVAELVHRAACPKSPAGAATICDSESGVLLWHVLLVANSEGSLGMAILLYVIRLHPASSGCHRQTAI